MNKLIYLVLSVAFFWTTQAVCQEEISNSYTSKGRIILGSSLGGSYTGVSIDGQDDNLSQINVEIDGGYFFINHLAAGIISGYTHTKLGDNSNWSLNLGAFARYYTKPNIFVGAGYLYSDSQDGDDFGTIPVELGYAYFFNRNVALEPAITLGIPANNNDNFIYSFGIGLGIYLR